MLNVPINELEDTYGVIKRVCNDDVSDCMMALAQAFSPMAGTSSIADETLAACKKVQEMYNGGFLDSLRKILKDFEETINIGEYLEKQASVGDISSADTSFNTAGVDSSAVII